MRDRIANSSINHVPGANGSRWTWAEHLKGFADSGQQLVLGKYAALRCPPLLPTSDESQTRLFRRKNIKTLSLKNNRLLQKLSPLLDLHSRLSVAALSWFSHMGLVLTLLVISGCRARGVFHITVPAPPKPSLFETATKQITSSISVVEDTVEFQTVEITLPSNFFDPVNGQSKRRTCLELLGVTSSDETIIPASEIIISDTPTGCLLSFKPQKDAWGNVIITPFAKDNPIDSMPIAVVIEPVDDPPTIASPGPQTSLEDTRFSLALVLSDDTPSLACNTALSASSDNPSLIQAIDLSVSGIFPQCILSYIPAANLYGTATITVNFTDGTTPVAMNFPVTILAVNDLPAMTSITSLTILEDTSSSAINFSVSDLETAPTCSGVIASSSNQSLIDQTGITIAGGTTQTCLITLTPKADQYGSAIITLELNDGLDVGTQSFTLNVTAVNDGPNLMTVPDVSIDQDTPTSTINISVNDNDGPTQGCNANFLRYTTQNTSVIATTGSATWGGSWPNCTVIFNPVSLAVGSAMVRVFVSDGSLESPAMTFTISVVANPLTIPPVTGGFYQEAYVKASNSETNDRFGSSVAISENTAIVGAPFEDSIQALITNGTTSDTTADTSTGALDSGAVYIYKRTQNSWAQEAYIKASNSETNDKFGTSVSLSGDTALVGAMEDSAQRTITNGSTSDILNGAADAGAVYIYRRTGNLWNQEAYIKASNAEVNDWFGASVAVSGDTAIVGAPWEDSIQASITNGTSSDMTADTNTGTLVSGASYIYRRTGTHWSQEAYIKASNRGMSDHFAESVDLSGDTAIVGARLEDSAQTVISNGTMSDPLNGLNSVAFDAGAGYVYRRTGSLWSQEAYIKASNSDAGDQFGGTVAISGDTLVVGASSEDSAQNTITNGVTTATFNDAIDAGAVYIFRRNGITWAQEAYIKASNAEAGDFYGNDVSISGDTVFVSAICEDSNQTSITNGTTASVLNGSSNAGAVYVYRRTSNIWAQESYIKASNSSPGLYFATSLAQSGDTAIVGVLGDHSAQRTITNGTTSDILYGAVAVGASYIYRNISRIFNPELRVSAKTVHSVTLSWGANLGSATQVKIAPAVQEFASSSCSDPQAITLAPGLTSYTYSGLASGTKYLFRVCGTDGTTVSDGALISDTTKEGWHQEAYIKASNSSIGAGFGGAVDAYGDTVIIGANGEASTQRTITNGTTASTTNTAADSGASYIYRRNATGWSQEAYVKSSNADSGDWFGSTVAISGDTALVGATYEASNQRVITNGAGSSANNTAQGSGAGYIYKRTGSLWAQEAYIKASNAESGDYFGRSVDISGIKAIVGAYTEGSSQRTITNSNLSSTNNGALLSGASYIYKRTGITWAQEAYLKASNADPEDFYGQDVALHGDRAIVGANNESSAQSIITNGITSSADNGAFWSGASYIYARSGTNWAQEAYIKASNAEMYDAFGMVVAITGDNAIISAKGESSPQQTITNGTLSDLLNGNGGSGASYIYRFDGAAWAQEAYVKSSNADQNDNFGSSLAISGDTAIVGSALEASAQTTITNGTTSSANNDFSGAGAVYVYKRSGNIWLQEAFLKASNAEAFDNFGLSIAISGDTIIVGAYGESSIQTTVTNGPTSDNLNGAQSAGASYIYKNTSRLFDPDLTVSAKTTSSITLSWGTNLGSAAHVIVVPAGAANSIPPACTAAQSISLAPGIATYTFSGLTTRTSYAFRVCSTDGSQVSEGSIIRDNTD